MKKIKFNNSITVILLILILLLIISISGCSSLKIGDYNINIEHVNSTDTINNTDIKKSTITSEERIKNNFISETHDDIINKFDECYRTLTTLQCKEWLKSYNGKYVKWNGIIYDVTANTVIVDSNKASVGSITLYDIPKEKLLKLNKDDKITFTGKIVIENVNFDIVTLFYSEFMSLKLYDVKIEEKE